PSGPGFPIAAPAHAVAFVRVYLPNGIVSPHSFPLDRYTFEGPQVMKVAPSHGPATGGNTVVVTGSGFTGAGVVEFDYGAGTLTEDFTVDSDSQITVHVTHVPPASAYVVPKFGPPHAVAFVQVYLPNGIVSPHNFPLDRYTFEGP